MRPGVTGMRVAYLLGFSDQSNFARSFRRWTGQTPSQYRASRMSHSRGSETVVANS